MNALILALTLITTSPAAAEPAQAFLDCSSNYTGTLSIQVENGSVVVKTTAKGFLEELPLAVNLGLDREPKFDQAEFAIPLADCLVNPTRPQLSCSTGQTQITFTAKDGQRVFFRTPGVDVVTGVMGEAGASIQRIELQVGHDGKIVSDVQAYKPTYNTVSGTTLCGRKI